MKTKIHALTALLLLTLPVMAGPFLNVRTEKQRAIIDAQVPTNMELRVFVGDESLGWSVPGSRAGVVISATVETSNGIRLDDGSLGKGFIFHVAGRTNYVAITPGGAVPFGEFVIRNDSKVTGINGTATFADIRKPDGTLVPVSVGVRKPQSDAKPEFSPLRFRILEITPHGESVDGKQTIVFRVAPHYGKIDTKSFDFRSQHETQNLTFVTAVDTGYDIRTNDIIGLQVSQHLKIGR